MSGATQRPPAVRVVLATLGAFLLVVTISWAVERVWLRGADQERIQLLYGVRVLLAFAIAALVATWMIRRRSGPVGGKGAAGAGPQLAGGDQVDHYAQWFILMRWIAVTVATVVVLVAIGIADVLPRQTWRPLMLTIAFLAAVNAVYQGWLQADRRARHVLLRIQAYGDLVILVVLLHFSGGIENPLTTLMLFHVIIAGIILTRLHCYLVALVGSALFGVMAWAEWGHWIRHYTLQVFPHFEEGQVLSHAAFDSHYALTAITMQTAVLFLAAYFTTTITERLRDHERQLEAAADRLAAQSQLLERALDGTDTGLCVCDREFTSSWSNGRWASWFGGTPNAVCVGAATGDGEATARETLRDGKVRVREVVLGGMRVDGPEPSPRRVFQVSTAPLRDQSGDPTHVVQLARDVTQEKRVQEGMVRAERLAAVGELAGMVAHEVNNPIAIISAKARLLLGDHADELTPTTAAELTKITHLSDRVARIAQGLLAYSRPPRGAAASLDIRIPLRRAVGLIEGKAAASGVRVEERLDVPLPEVQVNGAEMEQVFLNLLMNAIDAMPEGGRLTLSAWRDDGEAPPGARPGVVVLVEDSGRGVPPDLRDHVFEPYVTSKDEGQGTGLGLSICQALVDGNRGMIDLESEPGTGTRVRVWLPLPEPRRPAASHG